MNYECTIPSIKSNYSRSLVYYYHSHFSQTFGSLRECKLKFCGFETPLVCFIRSTWPSDWNFRAKTRPGPPPPPNVRHQLPPSLIHLSCTWWSVWVSMSGGGSVSWGCRTASGRWTPSGAPSGPSGEQCWPAQSAPVSHFNARCDVEKEEEIENERKKEDKKKKKKSEAGLMCVKSVKRLKLVWLKDLLVEKEMSSRRKSAERKKKRALCVCVCVCVCVSNLLMDCVKEGNLSRGGLR